MFVMCSLVQEPNSTQQRQTLQVLQNLHNHESRNSYQLQKHTVVFAHSNRMSLLQLAVAACLARQTDTILTDTQVWYP